MMWPGSGRAPMPPSDSLLMSALATAERNLRDVLSSALGHSDEAAALVVWDGQSELARALTAAYRRCLPQARFLAFDDVPREEVLAEFERLAPGDLVVLIQSGRFRLDAFRIRLELFKRSLKVVEHPHLERMSGQEGLTYFDALAYDPHYYRGLGAALKQRIDAAREAVIDSGGARLVYSAGLEPAKLNVGDYTHLPNVGGQFPIGEVFTESRDLAAVCGEVRIRFFGDTAFTVNRPDEPITLVVEDGRVTAARDSTPEFERVLDNIRADEGGVWLRELGLGMNRALTPARVVSDIGTFERMCGVHLSLGAKHASYNKPTIKKRHARHHVDVFVDTHAVLFDGESVFAEGRWSVGPELPTPPPGD